MIGENPNDSSSNAQTSSDAPTQSVSSERPSRGSVDHGSVSRSRGSRDGVASPSKAAPPLPPGEDLNVNVNVTDLFQLWSSLGFEGSPSKEALFDIIRLGAAVKQSLTLAEVDPLSIVDVVVAEISDARLLFGGLLMVSLMTQRPPRGRIRRKARLPLLLRGLSSPHKDRSRSPSVDKGPADLPPVRPADLPSPFMATDTLWAPTKPVHIKQRASTYLRASAHLLPKFLIKRVSAHMRAPVADVPVKARQRSPARQSSPDRQPTTARHARQCSPASQRSLLQRSPAHPRSSDLGAVGKFKTSPTRQCSTTRHLPSPARHPPPARNHSLSPTRAHEDARAHPARPRPSPTAVMQRQPDERPQEAPQHTQGPAGRRRCLTHTSSSS
ncbi:uncharacterized protein [Palaemon carinicauda]|uniref:uncharacterized protein n=1 Tax=Palaemon carinicauda TaxID=392227 RepID=UPI0035B5FEFF